MKFTSNAKERANALESFDKKLRQELQKLVNNTVVYLQGQAQTEAPVKTGFLRNSHQFRIGELSGEVRVIADYAGYVHDGTRSIRPNPWLSRARATTINWLRSQRIRVNVK